MNNESEQLDVYLVGIGDVAEEQIQTAFLGAVNRLGPDISKHWYVALQQEINSLSLFPHRNQADLIDGPAFPGREVRCQLFRFRSAVWRILYHIVEPAGDGAAAQVWIIRFRHAASRPLAQEDSEDQ